MKKRTLLVGEALSRLVPAPGFRPWRARRNRSVSRWRVLASVGAISAMASATVACSRGPTGPPEPRHLRVLFIGNSYTFTNDLPGELVALAKRVHGADSVETMLLAKAGYTLKQHWVFGDALQTIREGGWDFVVLQEQSQGPLRTPESLRDYATRFDNEIRRVGARTVLFITWALQYQPEDQAVIDSVYLAVAKSLRAGVAPVGPAWQTAIAERPQIGLYDSDGSHPAPAGTYLAAAVFYAVLFERPPSDDTATEEERFLQDIAWRTARRSEFR